MRTEPTLAAPDKTAPNWEECLGVWEPQSLLCTSYNSCKRYKMRLAGCESALRPPDCLQQRPAAAHQGLVWNVPGEHARGWRCASWVHANTNRRAPMYTNTWLRHWEDAKRT
jgi:hypothetical protein